MSKGLPFRNDFIVTLPYGVKGENWVSKTHLGIDLVGQGSKEDKEVLAVDDGTIVDVNKHGSAYGNHVFLSHPDGTSTLYAHLKNLNVKAGQKLKRGYVLGEMGATGNVSGPHLHFEVHNATHYVYAKNVINPAPYLGIAAKKGAKLHGKERFAEGGYTPASENQLNSGTQAEDIGLGYAEALAYDGPIYKLTGESRIGDIEYGRRYRVYINVGNGRAFDVSELSCTFNVVKTSFMEPNTSEITIYNLSPETENAIIKEGQSIYLEAGYIGEQYGQIFAGNIVQPLRFKEGGTTYGLTLVSMDGDRFLTYGLIGGVSLVAGQTARDIVKVCASKATVPIPLGDITKGLSTQKLPRGKVMFGMARDYLRQIAKSNNAAFSVQNGKATISQATDLPKNEIFYLSADSGLIGSPSQTEYGMTATMLLNPRIDIGSLVAIDNKVIRARKWEYGQVIRALDEDGIYRVIKLTHKGATRGGDWYTTIETVAQAGLGALPGLMGDVNINPQ